MTAPGAREATIAEGVALYQARDFAAAAAIFAGVLERVPDNPTALRLLGLCRVNTGDAPGGLRLLERARTLAPDDAEAALHHGIGLQAVGRFSEAAAAFLDCQSRLPDDPAPPLNLAAVLLVLGETAAAERAARRAVLRAPELAQAQYTLGLARLAGGQIARAAESFAEAVRLAPRFAEAWVNLGIARYRLHNARGARAAMSRALKIDPHHRAARANLAVLMRIAGNLEEGERLLAEALAADPDSREARVNSAHVALQEGKPNRALELLDVPPPRDARLLMHWQAQRSLALIQLGRTAEAEALLDALGEPPATMAPLLLWRRLLIAAHAEDMAAAAAFAERMHTALVHADILPEHRIIGYFELARFWSANDTADRGFACWVQGHRLLGRFQPFSRADYLEFIDETIARFDRVRLHVGARAGNRDAAPVFIVGMPRTGTTLTEQILAAHRDVFGAGERAAIGAAVVGLGGAQDSADAVRRLAALDPSALDRKAGTYLAELHALAPDKRYVVDKMPGNFRHLGFISMLLPGARIIHCDRDPRDIGLSIFTLRFFGNHPYAHDLSDLGWYIGQQRRLMAHWAEVLPNPMITVRLTDWVHDFSGTLARVLAFLDLPDDAACAEFYRLDRKVRTASARQVRQPINDRGLDRWQAHAAGLGPMIAALRQAGALQEGEA